MWLTSVILALPAAAQAQAAAPIAEARRLYDDGHALAARQVLDRAATAARDPAQRAELLGALLDLCIGAYDDACVVGATDRYVRVASPGALKDYRLDAARLALHRAEVTAAILDGPAWRGDDATDVELYLRRQVLGARIALAQGKPALAVAFLDRSLGLIASLEDAGTSRRAVAEHLAQAVLILAQAGQTERAHGLLVATGGFVGRTLPPRSVEAAAFAATGGSLLAEVGDLDGAARMLEIATGALQAIELDAPVRDWLLGSTLTLQAAIAAPKGDAAAARRGLDGHPLARLYAAPGRTPQTRDEYAYLAVRALTAAVEGKPDPVALAALTAEPQRVSDDPALEREAGVFRDFGRLTLTPHGAERGRILAGFAGRLRDEAVGSVAGVPGAWYRPSPIEKVMIALALSGADAEGPDRGDTAFALFQLGARFGPTFDSDALTALGQAHTPAQRETVHQALRLRAGRDRVERATIQALVLRPAAAGPARLDAQALRDFRGIDDGVAAAEQAAGRAGVPLSGANVVALPRFQAALAPDEAALQVTLSPGGLEYMCVRRDMAARSRRAADLRRFSIDLRLLRAALTATHAPSEEADVQFPVEAAVRLYDDLIRPFEGCLRPGDRVVWLSPVSDFATPLSALLAAPPPRLGEGWDLSRADWLVKRHAVSYPGSASVVIATRSGPGASAPLDFLGVGDPVLGEAKALLRGVRGAEIAELAPLPDTAEELAVSARGFRTSRLLLRADATEPRVRAELAKPYRYLSFATHGLVRDDLQGLAEPALVLTPAGGADAADDGLLTASEIADVSLAARFVALSACNTANFDLAEMSRELPALASAFAIAGAPQTLGTLWPVNSETGKAVVADTFNRLRDAPDAPAAVALAEAQRAFLAAPPGRAYLHPRFWAPFIVLGDAGPAAVR
ncbi:CHAT domain-containing protein [Phenylobacterium sp.]|uniref:CHAT domain-containing protein n=1 Tax=Phenylobacterium sp. TaxID=1871053 RepID=UPI0025DBE17B|nr:CHAT domain-containing protein [Phenylobacterium sp.]